MKALALALAGLGSFFGVASANSAEPLVDWQMWHQPAGSEMMAYIEWFDAYTFWFITPITIFVLLLLLYVMVRFRASANPEPSKTTHNTMIEVVWTVAPIVILIAIAIPSFDLLNRQLDDKEEASLTIKATGFQWYWGFEYQDDSEIEFESVMLEEDEREETGKTDKAKYPRLLAVDNEVVVPVGEKIRVLVTAADVIHNFAMPAFGLKMDGIPGRLNETWFKAEREGLYYGQCSELCGKNHAFMPIAIRVVSREDFDAWQETALDDLDAAYEVLATRLDDKATIKIAGN